MNSNRIIGLDIIRVIAITIVVIFHSAPILYPLHTIPAAGIYIHRLLAFTEPFGLLGVELFFVLSGFLIGTILIKVFIKSDNYGFADIRSFLVRRWLLLTAGIVLYTVLNLRNFDIEYWRYFLFCQNLWYKHPDFFPEAWSLAIEEWFYLTFPVILLIVSYLFKKSSKQKKILLTIALYILLFFSFRILVAIDDTDPLYFDWGVRKIVLLRLDAISYGVLIAYFYIYHNAILMDIKKLLLAISLTGITVVTAIHYIGIHPHFKLYSMNSQYRFFHNVFLLSLIPFFFSLSLPYAYSVKEIKNKFFTAIITTISKISYSIYLVHFTLIFLPFWQLIKYTKYNCIPIYLSYWAIVISISLLLYYYFELPVMNLRKYISKEDPKV
jgi:peptidoglycan/LPS O-acetylase OafA/YrhL